MCVLSLGKLLTYGHQICTVAASDICTPNDRFTSALTYFQGQRDRNVKNLILVQLGWHKL